MPIFVKVPGVDDMTGEPLIRRADDNPDTLKQRLKHYHQSTEPLIDFYTRLGLHRSVGRFKKKKKTPCQSGNQFTVTAVCPTGLLNLLA